VGSKYRVLSFGFFMSTTFLIIGGIEGAVPTWASGLFLVSFLNLALPLD
jgi:hypothetical protein